MYSEISRSSHDSAGQPDKDYKPDLYETTDLDRGDNQQILEIKRIEKNLSDKVKTDRLDLLGLIVEIDNFLRKEENKLDPLVLKQIKKYRDIVFGLKQDLKRIGILPEPDSFADFSRDEQFRYAIRAAAAREFLSQVGFSSFKSIDNIWEMFTRASDYLPEGILDKQYNLIDETTVMNALKLAREHLTENKGKRIPPEILAMIPEEYDLRYAVQIANK
jgi:hypothetical protein